MYSKDKSYYIIKMRTFIVIIDIIISVVDHCYFVLN